MRCGLGGIVQGASLSRVTVPRGRSDTVNIDRIIFGVHSIISGEPYRLPLQGSLEHRVTHRS